MVDEETARSLNLLIGSPTFVFRHGEVAFELVRPAMIPADGHTYSVAGESVLPDGTRVPSVFVIEDGGGNLRTTYWRVEGDWYEPSDSELDAHHENRMPFDWSYAVPVANDLRHDRDARA